MRHASRRAAAIFLALYAFLAGGLPLADAFLPAAPQTVETHIEDIAQRHHDLHDHLSCQLCRVIDRQGALDGQGAPALGPAQRTGAEPVAIRLGVPFSSARSELGARGPPTA